MRLVRLLTILFHLVVALPVLADEADGPSLHESVETLLPKPTPLFSTSIGFGLASDRNPAVSPQLRSGSSLILDTWKQVGNDISIGVRTAAFGSLVNESSYQRLASGILFSIDVFEKWRLSASYGRYSESGAVAGKPKYFASGNLSTISVLHEITGTDEWRLNSLGFWSTYTGSFRSETVASTSAVSGVTGSGHSRGQTNGLALSLEIAVR